MPKSTPKPIAGTKMPTAKKIKTDFYGSGIKNPEGTKMRSYMDSGTKKNDLKKPPKKMA